MNTPHSNEMEGNQQQRHVPSKIRARVKGEVGLFRVHYGLICMMMLAENLRLL
jgi:hypothetical protein